MNITLLGKKIGMSQIEQLKSSVTHLEKNLTLTRANLDSLLVRAFKESGWISFLTVGGSENRAWVWRGRIGH